MELIDLEGHMKMIQMMTFGLILATTNSLAQVQVNECLNELIGSQESHRLFPNLAIQARNNNFDERTLTYLEEAANFCKCHSSTETRNEIFPDKITKYANEDSCAGKNLMGESFQVHAGVAELKLSQEITRKLNQRFPRAIRQLASVGSYNQKMSCLHESIMRSCSRSKSLKMGYQCIQEITTSRDFSKYESKCPEFNDDAIQFTQNQDLMI